MSGALAKRQRDYALLCEVMPVVWRIREQWSGGGLKASCYHALLDPLDETILHAGNNPTCCLGSTKAVPSVLGFSSASLAADTLVPGPPSTRIFTESCNAYFLHSMSLE